jgi:hypothetical protein
MNLHMAISDVISSISISISLDKLTLSPALHPEHMLRGERRDASAFACKEPLSSATLAKLVKLLVERRSVRREFSDSISRPPRRSPSSMMIKSKLNGLAALTCEY